MGVSALPDCGFRNLSVPATGHELVRDFSSYFERLSPWEILRHASVFADAPSPVSCRQ